MKYTPSRNVGYYFMDRTRKFKHWENYYEYYGDGEYTNDVIIKCDDDIVFMDLDQLSNYLSYVRKKQECGLVFANTINNGVAAYVQQEMFNLIPKTLMQLELPEGGFCGSLWESGKKAETLHRYFLHHREEFLHKCRGFTECAVNIYTRFSINFFACRGKFWPTIKDCGDDDERNLTVDFVQSRGLINVMYPAFVVAHLTFGRQTDTFDSHFIRKLYKNVAINGE